LGKLSKKQRDKVIPLLKENEDMDTKSALKHIKQRNELTSELTSVTPAFNTICIRGIWTEAIQEIPKNSIDICICECPLSFNWFSDNMKKLAFELDGILVDGGQALIMMGHKSIGWAGEFIKPLNFLHVLTLRRRPGFTSFVPGINIGIASLPIAFAYKGKYCPPRAMMIDLQTFDIETGIEEGFYSFLSSLNCANASLTLINTTSPSYKLEETIIKNASELQLHSLFVVTP
jgi:hypothetical protein